MPTRTIFLGGQYITLSLSLDCLMAMEEALGTKTLTELFLTALNPSARELSQLFSLLVDFSDAPLAGEDLLREGLDLPTVLKTIQDLFRDCTVRGGASTV